jgi:outer membrane protein assembly factor BamA
MKPLFSIAFRRLPITLLSALAVCLSLQCPAVAAQTRSAGGAARSIPAADAKLIELKVTGSKRFTQQEIAAACGLPLGAIVGDEDFRKAARQLGETGAFNDISYTFTYSSAGTKLTFQVTDADKFVPAHFADFVWFTDQELLQKVHERAPLFDGELPLSGRMADQVSDILQALLVENNVPGHVDYLKTGTGGQTEAIDYAIANVIIRIRHVVLTGAGAGELPLLQAAAEKLSGRDYYRALFSNFCEHAALPIHHEHGYLKASCAAPQPNVVKADTPEATDDKRYVTMVDVTLGVTPGIQYKLAGWSWSGNNAIASDALQPLLRARTGQPANTVELEEDLRTIQRLYGSHGYITATIKANAAFDDAAGTVAYQLVVSEGPVFHMGELEFRGIDNNLTARLRAAWKIRPGDVYDSTYLAEYLPVARKLLPPTLDWEVSPHVTAIQRDKTVDVDLQYTAKAPQ